MVNQDYYNEKVDIWMAGITMFYLIKRKLPYDFNDIKELDDKISKG